MPDILTSLPENHWTHYSKTACPTRHDEDNDPDSQNFLTPEDQADAAEADAVNKALHEMSTGKNATGPSEEERSFRNHAVRLWNTVVIDLPSDKLVLKTLFTQLYKHSDNCKYDVMVNFINDHLVLGDG